MPATDEDDIVEYHVWVPPNLSPLICQDYLLRNLSKNAQENVKFQYQRKTVEIMGHKTISTGYKVTIARKYYRQLTPVSVKHDGHGQLISTLRYVAIGTASPLHQAIMTAPFNPVHQPSAHWCTNTIKHSILARYTPAHVQFFLATETLHIIIAFEYPSKEAALQAIKNNPSSQIHLTGAPEGTVRFEYRGEYRPSYKDQTDSTTYKTPEDHDAMELEVDAPPDPPQSKTSKTS
jgi:hypothetical protein